MPTTPHVVMALLAGVMFCGYMAGTRGRDAVAVMFQGVGYISGIAAALLPTLPIDARGLTSIGFFALFVAPPTLVLLLSEWAGRMLRPVWLSALCISAIAALALPLALEWACTENPAGFIKTCPYKAWWRS